MTSDRGSDDIARETLLIVDGHAYAYRAFFAIRSLSSPSGQATNAIYGFIRMLGKVLEKVRPTHAIVIWDGGLAEERMKLLPDYKAQRQEMPGDLQSQLEPIQSYLRAASISSFTKEGHEADDCIAAITCLAEAAGQNVVIASSDKDFMQLISPRVKMLNPHDKSQTLFGEDETRQKTGVRPGQIVDWLSLMGDSVDNIPGVPGVGAKTATDLLQKFDSIDELYKRLPEVSSARLRQSLQDAEEIVRKNQRLVSLQKDITCDIGLRVLAVQPVQNEVLLDLYVTWGFKTLAAELEAQDLFKGGLATTVSLEFEQRQCQKN